MNYPFQFCMATCVALFLYSGSGLAGPPLATDDADVLGRGDCELEGASTRGGDRAIESVLQVGCGLGRGTQLALALGQSRAGGANASGLWLAAKTRLWPVDAASAPAWSLAYGIGTASTEGGAWHHSESAITLVHSRAAAADAVLHFNLGHHWDVSDRQGRTVWGAALELARRGRFTPVAEVFGSDRDAPWWNAGLRFAAVENQVDLGLALARQIATGRPWTASATFTFAF